MARRSSRLSNRNSTTPKRVSLSHDAPARTPKTAPVKLGTLAENDEMPGAFPRSASPPAQGTPRAAPKQGVKVPVRFDDTTPKQATPIRPSHDEMHPAQHHQTTTKPQEDARWLGFAPIAPHTEPPKHSSRLATLQDTPTRISGTDSGITSPQYKFTFQREHSLELSPEAKKLMFEKREEAARIREQMMAAGEGSEAVEAAVARKIATPKGKTGRFSQAHLEHFQKMDSIAGHASAFRANPSWKKPSPAERQQQQGVPQSATKSLKRSPSKAQLDDVECTAALALARSPSKPSLHVGSSLPRATSTKTFIPPTDSRETSPAKRVKRFQDDDATITRPSSSGSDARQPGTPSPIKKQPSYPDLPSLASPTQASLARAASVKSNKNSKIPGPTLTRSPSKITFKDTQETSEAPSTPLLARSPSKASPLKQQGAVPQEAASAIGSPLLVRSPMKGPLFKKHHSAQESQTTQAEASLLARSPMKMSITKKTGHSETNEADSQRAGKEPLLARSPMKVSINRSADASNQTHQQQDHSSSTTALSSRSPMKMSTQKLNDEKVAQQGSKSVSEAVPAGENTTSSTAETPTKPNNKNLMDRFTFLRSSPMKSILRSPQRLYSDDPAKVAAGTHLATPPKKTASEMNKKLAAVAKTAPVRKHVDFTSSTKARYERAQSEAGSTPTKDNTPASKEAAEEQASAQPVFAQYPSLPTETADLTITPQKRRQTIAPGDFTFRAGPDGIVFGTSPNAPASMAGNKRPSTIRHVSAEPSVPASTMKKRKFEFENAKAAQEDSNAPVTSSTSSKKRKFEFENERVADSETGGAEDKENAGVAAEDEADGERPAKRAKPSAPSPEKKAKRPTLGVRPKGDVKGGVRSASGGSTAGHGKTPGGAAKSTGRARDKKPATISQARLAALAQPKRRT